MWLLVSVISLLWLKMVLLERKKFCFSVCSEIMEQLLN